MVFELIIIEIEIFIFQFRSMGNKNPTFKCQTLMVDVTVTAQLRQMNQSV